MVDKGALLRYYKRKDIQEAMVEQARDREVGVRYGEGFGKRPDVLNYPKEVIELVKQGAVSFHCSEERWSNPLELSSEISRKEMEELRTGWDLVLDIDCTDWEFSKLTAYLFIKALKQNKVESISCKFSGNKGFHIGIPFEAFPPEIAGQKTKELFPRGPQKIALYILDIISNNYVTIKDDKIIFMGKYTYTLENFKKKFGDKKFIINKCIKCGKEISFKKKETDEFICPKCDKRTESKEEFRVCDKCGIIMQKIEDSISLCSCGSNEYSSKFEPLSIIKVDTILISPRHLYRMPYSLHEKSGLASVVINPEEIMKFRKETACPERVKVSSFKFLGRKAKEQNGRTLLLQALDFEANGEEKDYGTEIKKDFEEIKIEGAIREEFFPPCVLKIWEGLTDGRKRGAFILMNFLGKVGWEKKEIERYLLEWNKRKNAEPLRENYILSQLRYFKAGDKLPPNCDNEAYYKDLGVCEPKNLCSKIKNPVNYTIIKWKGRWREGENQKGKVV